MATEGGTSGDPSVLFPIKIQAQSKFAYRKTIKGCSIRVQGG